ncbi:MAG TPA: hypothetical protein VGQ62_25040 [Chloroflexota bacterium]|jgi:cytoskeletal protein RodZ|nr:hypothetical protein [Chloroflexota bacterium]
MAAWLKRFSLHLAAAIGATGIFVAAAAVGASQTRQQSATVVVGSATVTPRPVVQRKPAASPSPSPLPTAAAAAAVATPVPPAETPPPVTPATQTAKPNGPAARTASPVPRPSPTSAPAGAQKVNPERSIAGTVKNVAGDGLQVVNAAGREFRVTPVPGALIRLNGKTATLDQLAPGDTVVILGQLQPGAGMRFTAHAVTARRT